MQDIGLHPDAGKGRDLGFCEVCDQPTPFGDTCPYCGRYCCYWCVEEDGSGIACKDCLKRLEQQPEADPSN